MNRSRAIATADRAASLSLRLIAAINVLFLISFLIVATLAASKARAEIPSGTGVDISDRLWR
jgi:uncharacterized protein